MKYTFLAAALLCVPALLLAQGVEVSWGKDVIDGHRTGVVASNASNVGESMGSVSGRKYLAPNGRIFRGGTVRNVARIMLEAQPAMAGVKQVIGYSTEEMIRKFRALTGIELRNILSKVLVAGEYGGTLAAVGAADGMLRDRGAVMHVQDQRTFPDMHCFREQGTSVCFGKR